MRGAITPSINILNLLVLLGLFGICVLLSFVLATQSIYWAAGAVLGTAFFAIGFLSPRLSLYILIFSMLLSPEIGSRDVTGEGFTVRLEDLLLIVMGFAWLAKNAIHKEIGLMVATKLNRPIFFYILACTLSTAWGIVNGNVRSPITGILFVMKYIEYFVVFFLTLNNISSRSHLKSLMWALFLTYFLVVVIGFSQIPQGGRISAPFEGESGEPNTLGGYLVLMLSVNIALFLNVNRTSHRIILGTLCFISFVAILYTLSRASWLGLIVMYMAMIVFTPRKRNILILAMVAGMIIAPFTMPKAVIDRALYTIRGGEEVLTKEEVEYLRKKYNVKYDTSTLARISSMKEALRDFQKHPVLGYGVTGYMFLDAQYHRVLIETGLVGLCAFLLLLFTTGRLLHENIKKYSHDPMYSTLATGTFCAFIGLLFHAIGTNTFIIVRIMEPFWCLVALNLSIPLIEAEEKQEGTTPPVGAAEGGATTVSVPR